MGRKAKRYKKEIDGKEEEKRRKKRKKKRDVRIYIHPKSALLLF